MLFLIRVIDSHKTNTKEVYKATHGKPNQKLSTKKETQFKHNIMRLLAFVSDVIIVPKC